MKYLIWFTAYAWNGDIHPARNYVMIQQDSIEFYIWDFYYTKWKIEYKLQESTVHSHYIWSKQYKQVDHLRATYLISYHGIKGIICIIPERTEIIIPWREGVEKIELLHLSPKKLKDLKR